MPSMDEKKQELTPEEKLLALIQQNKSKESAPSAAQTASSEEPPQKEKKIKLASESGGPAPAGSPARTPAADVKSADPKAGEKPKSAGPTVQGSPAAKTVAGGGAVVAKAETPAPAPDADDLKTRQAVEATARLQASTTGRVSGMGMTLLNRVLAVVVLVLLIGVVYSIASIRAGVAEELAVQIAGAGEMPLMPLVSTNVSVPPLDYYLGVVAKRDLFGLPAAPGQVVTNAVPVLQEKSDLKLMGVSLDAVEPSDSMAIIKNKPDSKTYFVKVGQAVGDTGFTLQRVLSDRVVLKSKKQELELK